MQLSAKFRSNVAIAPEPDYGATRGVDGMRRLAERWLVVIPTLMFLEAVVAITALSILFLLKGSDYNNLNNEGLGNAINAVGVVAAFYIIYGYGLVRIVSLAVATTVSNHRIVVTAIVGALVFGAYSALFLPAPSGPGTWIWVIWAIVIVSNVCAPFMLPKKVFE